MVHRVDMIHTTSCMSRHRKSSVVENTFAPEVPPKVAADDEFCIGLYTDERHIIPLQQCPAGSGANSRNGACGSANFCKVSHVGAQGRYSL